MSNNDKAGPVLPNLRGQLTREEMADIRQTILTMRHIIVPLLLELQDGLCAGCGLPSKTYDIDHLAYHPEETIYQLQLLCPDCHCEKHPTVHMLQSTRRDPITHM